MLRGGSPGSQRPVNLPLANVAYAGHRNFNMGKVSSSHPYCRIRIDQPHAGRAEATDAGQPQRPTELLTQRPLHRLPVSRALPPGPHGIEGR